MASKERLGALIPPKPTTSALIEFEWFTHGAKFQDDCIAKCTKAEGIDIRLETSKSCHKVFDLAGRRHFAGFKVALNA
jgi:hypothetical protein